MKFIIKNKRMALSILCVLCILLCSVFAVEKIKSRIFVTEKNELVNGNAENTVNNTQSDVDILEFSDVDYTNPPAITNFSSNMLYYTKTAQNLFANGDFETLPNGGWNTQSFIGSGILSLSNEKYRSGEKSLKVTINSDTIQTATVWLDIENDTNYIISMSLLGEFMSESNLANMVVQLINDKTGQPIETNSTYSNGICPTCWDNDWHRRAVAFNSGDAQKIGIRISGKSASCYIDDIMLCIMGNALSNPQSHDYQVDPLLALDKHKAATVIDTGNDIITCDDTKNLIINGSFTEEDTSFWSDYLDKNGLELSYDKINPSNRFIKYANNTPRNYSMMKYVEVEPNTEYTAFVRIRGDVEGGAAFTVLTGTAFTKPERLAKYSPDRWDGVWQTYWVKFNSNDDTSIGVGIFDGGGALSIDDLVVCKSVDASAKKAPNDALVIDFGDMIYPVGDINCDETVNADDLAAARRVLLEADEPARDKSADTNGDGVFDIRDLVHLKKYIAGVIPTL